MGLWERKVLIKAHWLVLILILHGIINTRLWNIFQEMPWRIAKFCMKIECLCLRLPFSNFPCRGDVQGSQINIGGVQQAPGGFVRDSAVAPEPSGHTGRHIRHEHVRPAGIHVQRGSARVAGRALKLPESCRVFAGKRSCFKFTQNPWQEYT